MGAFLDKPKTEKHNADGAGNSLRYGLSSVHGWRVEMEDAHTAVVGIPHGLEGWSFFAVYDGHAGSRVANYCSNHLLEHVTNNEDFRGTEQPGSAIEPTNLPPGGGLAGKRNIIEAVYNRLNPHRENDGGAKNGEEEQMEVLPARDVQLGEEEAGVAGATSGTQQTQGRKKQQKKGKTTEPCPEQILNIGAPRRRKNNSKGMPREKRPPRQNTEQKASSSSSHSTT